MKAVSYLIAVVLVALVTVALGVALYAHFHGWIAEKAGSARAPEGVLVVETAYYNSTSTEFVLYVRNDGKAPVTIDRGYVTLPDGTVRYKTGLNTPVKPGEVVTIKINATELGISVGADEVYTIKLVALDGSETTTSIRT